MGVQERMAKKLQQFWVYSYTSAEIEESRGRIRCDYWSAYGKGNIISVADNEVLRAIRRITKHKYSGIRLKEIKKEIRERNKEKNTEANRKRLGELNDEIAEQLFIPHFVSVEFTGEKDYIKLNKQGFFINGVEYTWLMCGASHQRTNRAMYVSRYIYEELNEIIQNGAELKEMVLAKYNAYYALSSTATYKAKMPRVCVIADKEIEMAKMVDFVCGGKIERCEKEINFNLFDGQGLVSPAFSAEWAKDIGIKDYIPSAWGIRCAFIKGMCVTFDFHKFAKEVANKDELIDVWGDSHNVKDIDVILTQSQFKLWDSYKSWNDYCRNLIKNKWNWGICKITPKINEEKDYMFTNYQFLQILNLDDKGIKSICAKTIKWLSGVLEGEGDIEKLYLLGKIANSSTAETAWERIQDNFIKAIMLNSDLMNDDYIRGRILKSINKKIRETYFGNLVVNGNFMARISDPYALCEHAFNLTVKGLLDKEEHYSWYWVNKKIYEVVAMRSPLTYKTEAHKLKFKENEKIREWYKYLTSGVVYNIWGVDCLLEAGADYDFDIVATTDDVNFLNGICGKDIPVVYEARKPPKETPEKKRLMEIAGKGFNTKIGYLTNLSTTLYEMQSEYEINSAEWKEIENRLKLCCELQSMQIDKAKGLEIDDIPKHWTNYNKALEEDFGEKGMNCELIIKDRPYFMRFRYKEYNKKYNEINSDFEKYCKIVFGKGMKEVKEEKELWEYYNKKIGLLKTNGIVNRICYFMQEAIKEIKENARANKKRKNIFEILYNYDIGIVGKDVLEKMKCLYCEYQAFRNSKALSESEFRDWAQYAKYIREKALKEISSDIKELANVAVYICYSLYPCKMKDFCWDCFGSGIIENLKLKENTARIPIRDKNGDIEYLGKMYSVKELKVSKEENDCNDMDYDKIIEEIENTDEEAMSDFMALYESFNGEDLE